MKNSHLGKKRFPKQIFSLFQACLSLCWGEGSGWLFILVSAVRETHSHSTQQRMCLHQMCPSVWHGLNRWHGWHSEHNDLPLVHMVHMSLTVPAGLLTGCRNLWSVIKRYVSMTGVSYSMTQKWQFICTISVRFATFIGFYRTKHTAETLKWPNQGIPKYLKLTERYINQI